MTGMTPQEAIAYLRPIMESASLPNYQAALSTALVALEVLADSSDSNWPTDDLLHALETTAADNHRCFGCGHEWSCSIHGCAINRAAADRIKALLAEVYALRHPDNLPLTLDELQEIDGEPVWITPGGFWALVIARPGERVRLINHEGEIVWADKEIELVGPVYRRKLEEGTA